MRLFVALIPPPEVVADLDDFLASRRAAGPDLRWTDPEQMHVTLAFLPQVSEPKLEPLLDALSVRCARIGPHGIRLGAGGALPSPYAARVLVLGADPQPWLGATAKAVRSAAAHAGSAVDGGRFIPHATVARMRRPIEATRWVRILHGYESPGWVAAGATLVRSHLGQGRERRPRYESLAEFAFGTGDGPAPASPIRQNRAHA